MFWRNLGIFIVHRFAAVTMFGDLIASCLQRAKQTKARHDNLPLQKNQCSRSLDQSRKWWDRWNARSHYLSSSKVESMRATSCEQLGSQPQHHGHPYKDTRQRSVTAMDTNAPLAIPPQQLNRWAKIGQPSMHQHVGDSPYIFNSLVRSQLSTKPVCSWHCASVWHLSGSEADIFGRQNDKVNLEDQKQVRDVSIKWGFKWPLHHQEALGEASAVQDHNFQPAKAESIAFFMSFDRCSSLRAQQHARKSHLVSLEAFKKKNTHNLANKKDN